MKELKALLEACSCQRVQTYIQSGNVVFERESLPEKVGELIQEKYGFEPRVLFLEKTAF